jgi:HK97 family phage portal protein
LVKEGYRRNELIYACIKKKAASATQLGLQVVNKRTREPLDAHPLLDLIHKPNDYMNESDFWGAITSYQHLAGRAIFEVEQTNGGDIAALWPLNPQKIQIEQDEKRPTIKNYIYKVSEAPRDWRYLTPKQVLDFPLFDPLERFKAYPPVAVCARAGDVDNAATDHIKLIWEHGGMPAGLLKSTQRLNDQQVSDIRRRWRDRYGGHTNWIEPAILDSDAEYQKTGMTFKELGFDVLDAREEARICMVLEVPPILVGAKIGLDRATYANYKEARSAFWEDTLVPMYYNFLDVIEYRLLPFYDPGGQLAIDWDMSQVFAFQEDENAKWVRALSAWNGGAIKLNQFFELVGLDNIGELGEYYLRSSATVEVPAGTGIRETPEPVPAPDVQPDDGVDNEPVDDGEPGGKSSKAATNAPDDVVRRKHERVIKKAMQDYFDGQMERVKKDAAKNNGH